LTCQRQLPLLKSLVKEKTFDNAVAYQVSYDDQKVFLRNFKVRWQSTLIVFRGNKEMGRSVADLKLKSIRRLFLRGF